MNEITFELKIENGKDSIYQQIYEHICQEIKNGNLKEGTKLPSTRALAKHLEISRSTVDMAYGQLVAEGYVYTVPAKGYYVADVKQLYNIQILDVSEKKDKLQREEKKDELPLLVDFSPKGVDLNKFPFNIWRKLTKEILSADNKELFATGNPKGEVALRQTICEYLYEARGVKCSYHQIFLGAGYEYLLMILSQIFEVLELNSKEKKKNKKRVAMESPTYIQAYNVFSNLGYQVELMQMDENGMDAEQLEKSKVNLSYVMPSHQFPTGVVMPLKRRLEMLQWAQKETNRYIIEDDYDSEFRYVGKPIPALKAIDENQKVIYLGTFSKSIAPGIRMSYMVLPQNLLECYHSKLQFYSTTVSRIDQAIVNEFIRRGFYARHLNRMRSIYRGKHETLLKSLKELPETIITKGENAGLHILIEVPGKRTEEELVREARAVGVKVYSLKEYQIGPQKRENPTLILGYAKLTEEEIQQGIRLLGKVLRKE